MENSNELKNQKSMREKGNVEPQNQHYNIKKQALGPNSKRGR